MLLVIVKILPNSFGVLKINIKKYDFFNLNPFYKHKWYVNERCIIVY
jgi:hypothetical protein